MKNIFLILTSILLTGTSLAQNGFYIGYENGGLFDKYHYVNSKGFSLSQTSIGGVFGGYVGYKNNSYNIETGFYGYYSYIPFIDYNYNTGKASKLNGGCNSTESWVIPVRLGKEFLISKQKIFIKSEFAINTIISRDYSEVQPTMGWGENVSAFPGDNSFIPITADSTRAYGYVNSKLNFSCEASLSTGYRFKKKADIYIKGSYVANFRPLYYETITHYSDIEIVNATRVNVNSFLLQIGLKYYFGKQDK
jgi:hypothetical protein